MKIPDPLAGAVAGGAGDPIGNPTPEVPEVPETPAVSTPTIPPAPGSADPQLAGLKADPTGRAVGEKKPEPAKTEKEQKAQSIAETVSQAEWLAWMREDIKKSGPYQLSRAEIDALPHNAKMAFAQLTEDGAKAKLELEQREKVVTETAAKAAKDAELAAKSKAAALDWTQNSELKARVEKALLKPGEAPDPLDPAGAARLAEAKAAEFMRDFLGEIEKGQKAAKEQAEKLEAEAAKKAELDELESYANKHAADFNHPVIYEEIKKELQEVPGLSIQRAHRIVMDRRLLADLQARKSEDLEAARKNILRAKPSEDAVPEIPTEYLNDDSKLIDFFKRNPEAARRYVERERARGTRT